MLVNPEILLRELEAVREVDPTIDDRLIIDARAGILDRSFHEEEGGTEGELHQRIGSTGEGVGAARIARIRRDPSRFKLAKDVVDEYGLRRYLRENTPKLLRQCLDDAQNVLLEGTQGSGLSLIHGPCPYVTSHDTNAAQLAADAGIPPMLVNRVLLVARTYPIRTAGNSGPLKNELTWEEISRRVGKQVTERTTVTNKIRRVDEWDEELLDNAVTLNRPTSIAVTFMDYLSPQDEGKTRWEDLSDTAKRFVWYVESRFQVQVSLIGTGGPNWNIVDRGFAV
jgi:adenylosuccinate synthase